MKPIKILTILSFVLALAASVQAATITSAQSGYWNDIGTWIGGVIPNSTDEVIIASGHNVLFDRNDTSTTCGTIEIRSGGSLKFYSTPSTPKNLQVKGDINVYGSLELVAGSSLKLECDTGGQYGIVVFSGGTLKGTGSIPTVLTTLSAPLAIGDKIITVTSSSGFGVGDIITLGSGASTEGFTILALSGSQITLNHKALNAQASGSEVYKNATVTTAPSTTGSKTLTVADLGGIKAGDNIIAGPTDKGSYWQKQAEIRTVESISSNNITVSSPFSYYHSSGAIVVKSNRDALISSVHPNNQNGYIYVDYGGRIDIAYTEFVSLGTSGTMNKNGITIMDNKIQLKGNSIHDNYGAVYIAPYSSTDTLINVTANIWCNNQDQTLISGGGANVISNIFMCGQYWWGNLNMQGSNNLIAGNYILNGEKGVFVSDKNSCYLFNTIRMNGDGILMGGSRGNLFYGNTIGDNGEGIFFMGCSANDLLLENYFKGNKFCGIELINYSNIDRSKIINSDFKDNLYAIEFNNTGYQDYRVKLSLLDCSYVYLNNAAPVNQLQAYIISRKDNHQDGITKIYGDYVIPSSEVGRFNYNSPSYASFVSDPILLRGQDHQITTPETDDAKTTNEVWVITYRAAAANWEVKGTVSGLQSARAQSGVDYYSDQGQVGFTITQDPGVQDGDQFVFAAVAAAGDANKQKKIFFEPSAIAEFHNQSQLTVSSAATLEMIGTFANPTLIDYDRFGGYGILVSGEVNANYFDFNQVNSGGVRIDAGATIANFNNGSIRNISGAGPHLAIKGNDHTFNSINLDNSGGTDVKASGNSHLVFARSQRGTFSDSIADTSSISWDDPVLGYTADNITGPITFDAVSKIVEVPFKIKDPNSLSCTFMSNSFQYSTDGGSTWRTISDSDLSGIGGSFSSSIDYGSAPQNKIYWNTGLNFGNLEANLIIRFRVYNGYVYGNYGSSEVLPLNIKPPIVQLISPNGGELYKGGAKAAISWSATDEGSGIADSSIKLYYNDGASDTLIASNLANTGNYAWTVPLMNSDTLKVKIEAFDKVGQKGSDLSDGVFTIDSIPPAVPTIDPVKTPTILTTQLVSGTKSSDTKYIYINGSCAAVTYPDSTSWSCRVTLAKGVNTISVYAQDMAGNKSGTINTAIEAKDLTFTGGTSQEIILIPFGSVTQEVNAAYFSQGALPAGPMRGARAVQRAWIIYLVGENYSSVTSLSGMIQITLPLPAGTTNPRVYFWDEAKGKWCYLPSIIQNGMIQITCDHLGPFAVFDIFDTQGPNIFGLKINGLSMSNGDSITDCPVISAQANDDYGLDLSSAIILIDNSPFSCQSLGSASALNNIKGSAVTNGEIKYNETNALSVGEHLFMLIASDEVGNASSLGIKLFVVGSSIPGLMVYPNPYSLGGQLKFDGLSGDVSVYIYDAAGDLVWQQSASGAASISWDGRNSAGNMVAPGVYFYLVKNGQGSKSTGKLAVIK